MIGPLAWLEALAPSSLSGAAGSIRYATAVGTADTCDGCTYTQEANFEHHLGWTDSNGQRPQSMANERDGRQGKE